MWHHILTFGAEGTEAGNFCRPWGVSITRYSDIASLSESFSHHHQQQQPQKLMMDAAHRLDKHTTLTGATSSDFSMVLGNTGVDHWTLGLGDFGYGKQQKDLVQPTTIGNNVNTTPTNNTTNLVANKNSIGSSIQDSAWSTYLIGIADRSNNRIQLFKFDAIRQTVTFLHMFGDGPGARHGQFDRPAGLVFNPKLEQIIVADKDNHRVQVFDISGAYLFKFGERGSKCGQFCYPWDIDVCKTSHNLIVSDTRNRRVQMFNNLGRYITHFNQPLDSPRGVVYLNSLQFMISDFNKHRLVMVTHIDDKTVTSSTPIHSMTNKLETEYLNNNNNTNTNNNHIPQTTHYGNLNQKSIMRPLTHQPLHESKFIGFGEGSSWGEFLRPQGLAANGSMVFCSDSRNNRVACWNKETQAFSYISKDTVDLDRPAGLATIDNYIVIVDFGNNRVFICQRFSAADNFPFETQVQSGIDSGVWKPILSFGTEGSVAGNFCRPWGVTIARYSDLPSLSDSWSQLEREFNATSASSSDYSTDWPLEASYGSLGYNKRKFINPAIGSTTNNNNSIGSSIQGSAWSTYLIGIADRSNNRIQLFKFDAIRQTVTFLHMFGDGPGARHGQFDRPAGLVFNPKLEQIIVADKDNHRVQVFDISGAYLFKFGERGSKCGQFCYPWDIDVCKTSHNLIVSDTRNRRVQMFNNLGRYITHFNQPLDSPRGVIYLNPLQFMISDFNKHRLLMVTHVDDKTVTSSTPVHSMTKSKIEYLNNNQLPRPHYGNLSQKSVSRPLTQALHESKFIGFGEGSSWGEFLRPQGLASNGSMVFCSDSRNNRVACWNKETQAFSYISKDTVKLDRPAGLATIDNYIVIVDFGNNRVHICQQ